MRWLIPFALPFALLLAGCAAPQATVQPVASSTPPTSGQVTYAVLAPAAPAHHRVTLVAHDLMPWEANGTTLPVDVPANATDVQARLEQAASASGEMDVALTGCGKAVLADVAVQFGGSVGPVALCAVANAGTQAVHWQPQGVGLGRLVVEADVPG